MREKEWDWRGLWLGLPPREKPYLRGFFLLTGAALLWAVGGWLYRYDFSEALIPLTFQEESIEPVREVEVSYRTYLVEAPIRRAFALRAADILLPRWWSFGVGWVAIVVGWAALLTAASRMEGFLPYLIYFAWVAWVVLSKAAQFWSGTDPFYVVSLGLSLVVLLPVYLVGTGMWRLRIGATAVMSGGLVATVLGAPTLWRGAEVLYTGAAAPAVISYAAAGIVGLQVPIALLTVLIYPPSLRYRRLRGLYVLLGTSSLLIAALLFLPMESAYTTTVLIVGVGAALAFAGLQPYYPTVGASFRQPTAFFWGWGGLMLIGMGAWGFHAWNHQDLYIYRAAGLWRAMLLGGIGGMTAYLGWNFLPLWRAGKVSYWELNRSVRLPLAVVYFLAVGSAIFNEAQNDWPTMRFPARIYAVNRAEAALLAGRWDEAEALYREALYFLPFEAKLNYNLARLQAQRKEAIEAATDKYERALLGKPFLPAALQASAVWLTLDRPVRALQILQSYYHRFGGDWVLCNQLAYAFYKVKQLDSAAYYWKEAIRRAPGQPEPYAHLALLYALYEKPTWAAKIAEHITGWAPLPEAVQEDLAYLQIRGILKEGRFEGWNAQWLGAEADTSAVGRFISALGRGDIPAALGFIPYFREHDPELAPRLIRQVGIKLLQVGSPRRAAELFLTAGTAVDSLYAGYAYAESGCWDIAYALISRLWGSYPELESVGRREVSLLLAAAGRSQEMALLDPPQSWTDADYLRFGYYAYLRRDIQNLVVILRPWIDADAKYDAPFEWVARLFLQQGDTSGAEENIQAGLARVPRSVRLRLLQAEIWHARRQARRLQALLDSVSKDLRTSADTLLWETFQLKEAPQQAATLLRRFPYHLPAMVSHAQLLLQKDPTEAHKYLSSALEVHPYAPELWALYAEASEKLGMSEEAEFARKKPDPCPPAL